MPSSSVPHSVCALHDPPNSAAPPRPHTSALLPPLSCPDLSRQSRPRLIWKQQGPHRQRILVEIDSLGMMEPVLNTYENVSRDHTKLPRTHTTFRTKLNPVK